MTHWIAETALLIAFVGVCVGYFLVAQRWMTIAKGWETRCGGAEAVLRSIARAMASGQPFEVVIGNATGQEPGVNVTIIGYGSQVFDGVTEPEIGGLDGYFGVTGSNSMDGITEPQVGRMLH